MNVRGQVAHEQSDFGNRAYVLAVFINRGMETIITHINYVVNISLLFDN
jgi:hypothetical protein